MKHVLNPEPLLDVRAAARYLGVSRGTIHRWTSARLLGFYKLPSGLRFKASHLDEFLEEHWVAADGARIDTRSQYD